MFSIIRPKSSSSNIILAGDLNCDLLNPDGGAKEGRALIDLAEVYRLSNLIKEPKQSQTLPLL